MSLPTSTIFSPSQRVFSIPELVNLVSLPLDKKDLIRLLRVSRCLFTYFRPYLWGEIANVLCLLRLLFGMENRKGTNIVSCEEQLVIVRANLFNAYLASHSLCTNKWTQLDLTSMLPWFGALYQEATTSPYMNLQVIGMISSAGPRKPRCYLICSSCMSAYQASGTPTRPTGLLYSFRPRSAR
jgi:hypothetical protein